MPLEGICVICETLLIHGEGSWKRAMMQGEGTPMDIQDIKEDATRFRVRRFLLSNLEQFHKRSLCRHSYV